MFHLPRFWKHKESKEVIDHLTYSDLNNEHRANYDECDVTGELLNEPQIGLATGNTDDNTNNPSVPDSPVVDAPTTGTPVIETKTTTGDTPIIQLGDVINFAETTDDSYIGNAGTVEEENN